MDKTYGEKKRKYMNTNKSNNIKSNNKKPRYSHHHNKDSIHSVARNYVTSHVNRIMSNRELLNEFTFTSVSSNFYT